MKKIVLSICLLPVMLWAQQQKAEGIVTNDKKERIPQAKVYIYDQNNTLLKSLTTDEKGSFTIEGIDSEELKIVVDDLEYDKLEKVIKLSDLNANPNFVLKKSVTEIQEVSMTKQKPVVKRKIDRLEFNVENSNISSLNGWEILKKTPGVVFSNDAFKIKGSSAILVTINDKKVSLSSEELKNLLENTQGSDVKSVEVITNPPAKYEASGSAVLNIVLKQNKLEGYRGYVTGKYVQSIYPKGVGSIAQYYKKGKISAMASYSRGAGAYYREESNYIYYPENQTTWRGIMNRKDINNSQNTVNSSLEYTPDDKTTFTLNYRGHFAPRSAGLYFVPNTIYNAQNIAESYYNTINDHNSRSINNNVSLQVERKFDNSTLSLTTYYITSNYKKYENVLTDLNFANQPTSTQNFISNNWQDVKLFSQQVDYGWKKDKWELEAGGKYSLVKTTSTLDFSDDENGKLVYRPDKSNIFNYTEGYIAAYASASLNFKKWAFKAGLRTENTNLNGVVSTPYEKNTNDYWKLFPTAYIQYTTDSKQQFGLSYGKRISRPSYSWLNPAKSYYNLFSYFQGDPKLKATISHNLSFTYNVKDWNFEVYYRKDIDPSMEISYQVPQTNTLVFHYTNIQKANAFGASLYKNFQLKPWWTLSVSEDFSYNENYFFGQDQQLYENKIYNLNSTISTSFTLQKVSDWTLEIGHQYYSPSIQGTFRISGAWEAYLVTNRKFFDKKLEASLFFLDIFKTSKQKIATKYANQDNYFIDYRDTQQFVLQLKYNFGNQKVKGTKTIKKTDEQNRM